MRDIILQPPKVTIFCDHFSHQHGVTLYLFLVQLFNPISSTSHISDPSLACITTG